MPDYFAILGLEPSASLEDIKKSYRNLVKLYHPDLNQADGARERFMKVHEAYEYLSSEYRRQYLRQELLRSKLSDGELKRREEFYRNWVDRQQRAAQIRAEQYAASPFDDFKKSRIYRTAMAVSKAYNFLFIFLCLLMIIGPMIRLVLQADLDPEDRKPLWHFIFPVVLGLLFSSFGYYYLFVRRVDDE